MKNVFSLKKHTNQQIYTSYALADYFIDYFLTDKDKEKSIGCPCDTEDSNIVKVLKEKGFNVEYFSDLYNSELLNSYDIIITNPPFNHKKETFELLTNLTARVYLIYGTSITDGITRSLPYLTKHKRLLSHIVPNAKYGGVSEKDYWCNSDKKIPIVFLSLNDMCIKQNKSQFRTFKKNGDVGVCDMVRYLQMMPINKNVKIYRMTGKTGKTGNVSHLVYLDDGLNCLDKCNGVIMKEI